MNFQEWIILIPILLMILLIIVTKCKDYFSILRTVNATLIDKYSDTYNSLFRRKTDYFLAFSVDNKKIVLLVTDLVYESFEKGKSGTLIYKNNTIIKFE